MPPCKQTVATALLERGSLTTPLLSTSVDASSAASVRAANNDSAALLSVGTKRMADQNASPPRSHRSGSESSKFDGISMHCGACCCLSAAAATCMLLFFSLHSSKADSNADDVGPSWAIVLAPLITLSLGVLLALVAALACVGMRSQAAGHPFMPTGVVPTAAPKPSVRLVATYGLSALGVLLVCLQIIHAERHAGQPRLPWALALSPVALMLGVRAVTVPPPPPLAFGAPEPDGLICWRWVNRAEIILGGAALVRLYAMVRATESGGGVEDGTDGTAIAVRHGAGGGASSRRSSFSM